LLVGERDRKSGRKKEKQGLIEHLDKHFDCLFFPFVTYIQKKMKAGV